MINMYNHIKNQVEAVMPTWVACDDPADVEEACDKR